MQRAEQWFGMLEYGMKTLLERTEPSRSDCHAWSSHILYHCFATLLEVRPTEAGNRQLTISPVMGHLTHACGTIPLPHGNMSTKYLCIGDSLNVTIDLPSEVNARFIYSGQTILLHAGHNSFTVSAELSNRHFNEASSLFSRG